MKKSLILLTLFIEASFSAQAQSVTKDIVLLKTITEAPKVSGSAFYFSLAYEHEGGGGPRNGLSISIMGNPGSKGKYFLGVRSSILMDNQKDKKSYAVEYILTAITFDLTQRLFIRPSTKFCPFIDFDFGYRTISNSASVSTVYGSKATGIFGSFGLSNYQGGQSMGEKELSVFSADLGIGCFFNLLRYKGPFVKLSYKYAGKFELIDKNSWSGTYSTKPGFVTLSMGLMIGKGRPISK